MLDLLNTLVAMAALAGDTLRFSGRDRVLSVPAPRSEAVIHIDGTLDEPVWSSAARLVGFSSYFPTDDQPARDSTEVVVWYGPHAMYFGVRAFAAAGDVRATLTSRDDGSQDDAVFIFLSTSNDGRQAYMFGVNPFGIQIDGTLNEGGAEGGDGFLRGITGGRPLLDPSPNFVYTSKGRVTEFGFEVEIEVPFKSLRYQSKSVQSWGIHVERTHRATGAVSSWVPAKRDVASYLGQAGTLTGLTDLRRGLVLDLNPVVTSSVTGARVGGRWDYLGGSPRFGGDVRWGATPDLTVSGTVRPDFSQVEADAGQISFDPRSALFFPEKRPFFLEGVEFFETTTNLVYTRRIVEPVVATKLTGKIGRTGFGVLAALDDRATSRSARDNPVFAIARIQRDLGASSKIGGIYTGRFDGTDNNQVLGGDARFTLGPTANLDLAAAASRTVVSNRTTSGPIWNGTFSLGGRRVSLRYNFNGVSDHFQTESGFVGRLGVANLRLVNQLTFYGKPTGLFERGSVDFSPFVTWRYRDFVQGREAQDHKYHLNATARLRGGWSLGGAFLFEYQRFDPELYGAYAIERPNGSGPGDTVAFRELPRLHNVDGVLSIGTPELGGWSASVFGLWGRDVNFFEWARAAIVQVTAEMSWRPSDQLRLEGSHGFVRYRRHSDGSVVGRTDLSRLKTEYQLTRSLFVRAVVEYRSDFRDALRDDSRTNLPLVIRNPGTGQFEPAGRGTVRNLFLDWLVAFQPSPGTVVFAGYGNTRQGDTGTAPAGLTRLRDGFFLKLSYLFRS